MTRPTVGEIRAKIDAATESLRTADARFAQLAFEKLSDPDVDTRPALALLAECRTELATLEAILPVVEREEAEELEATRAKLAEGQRRALERALKDLLKHSMSFAVHQQNAVSAYRRMASSGAEASRLLFDAQRTRSNGYLMNRLSPGGLKIAADREINRLGLRREGETSAPGTNSATVDLRFRNAASQLPTLEEDTRRLISSIMASAPEPLARPQESAAGASLPQVADGAGTSPTASAELQGAE